ncbi:hypothetical protein AB0Y04_13640, partial [Loigolactobacillus coryniformis]|uniref:hypothetical protein n=1 Tax=Loigolactobacillus coryniformis TaxID=1610 RepID=UPI003F255922
PFLWRKTCRKKHGSTSQLLINFVPKIFDVTGDATWTCHTLALVQSTSASKYGLANKVNI